MASIFYPTKSEKTLWLYGQTILYLAQCIHGGLSDFKAKEAGLLELVDLCRWRDQSLTLIGV
jgi:hypothetical protein